jgi:glycosyltransferase involved in cell wall biosynthesis
MGVPTNSTLPVTVWMNMPSFYQSDLFRALAADGQVDLRVIFAADVSEDRAKLGWSRDATGFEHHFLDKQKAVVEAWRIAGLQRERVHIFNGTGSVPAIGIALLRLALAKSKMAIYSEAPERLKVIPPLPTPKWKAGMQAVFKRLVVPNLAGAFAVSKTARDYFLSLGVRDEHIYRFGYFRSAATHVSFTPPHNEDEIEVIYVGSFEERKRLDLLLDAMSPFFAQYSGLRLSLIGDGDLRDSLQRQVDDLGIVGRVRFEGVLPATQILARIARAGLLVLPSRSEGWGLVVNEALSVGVPVVLSSACGARELIRHEVNGYVFASGDAASLQACLRDFLKSKENRLQLRRAAAAAGDTISTENVAPYFVECLRHMLGSGDGQKPVPPWMKADHKKP